MALLRTALYGSQNVCQLLQHSQRLASQLLKITSICNLQGLQLYSSSNAGAGYKTAQGQDFEEEHRDNCFPDYGIPLAAWHFEVNSSGRLNLTSKLPVHIESLDHQKYPEMKSVFMNMLWIGKDSVTSHNLANMAESFVVSTDLDEDGTALDLNVDLKSGLKELPNIQCHIQVPVKYDIHVTCKAKADASIQMLESETITVHTEQGNCFMNNLKCNRVDISTQGGDIHCKSVVQGNITMATMAEGSIKTGRLQGQTISCQTEKGEINVKALYSETCNIKSSSGRLLLSNCHGVAEVESDTGNVTIDTMDGDLQASVREGDVDVFLAREGHHCITSESGNVTLKLPSLNSNVELKGKEVDCGNISIHGKEETVEDNLTQIKVISRRSVNPFMHPVSLLHMTVRRSYFIRLEEIAQNLLKGSLGESGARESSIKVSTSSGKIELQSHSWLSSLNLNNMRD